MQELIGSLRLPQADHSGARRRGGHERQSEAGAQVLHQAELPRRYTAGVSLPACLAVPAALPLTGAPPCLGATGPRAEQAKHYETKKRAPAKKKPAPKVSHHCPARLPAGARDAHADPKTPVHRQAQATIKRPARKALKVRKPTTAFMFFSRAMKDGVQGDFPDATNNERTKIVNEL